MEHALLRVYMQGLANAITFMAEWEIEYSVNKVS